MAASLIPIIIAGAVLKAAPHVANFLIKHGFKKATKNITQNKDIIPKINLNQAKNIVNKKQNINVDSKEFLKNYKKSVDEGYQVVKGKTLDSRLLDSLINAAKKARLPPRQPHQRQGDLAFPNIKTKAKELTDDPKIQKFLKGGPRKMKQGGRIGKPKGVGVAKRGYGKAMKRGK
jgi:hypothetical protein